MKTLDAGLAAHYAQPTTTVCDCLKLEPEGEPAQGLTSLDRPITVDGVTYQPGLNMGAIEHQSGLAVDNTTWTLLPRDALLLQADLLAGRWDNLKWTHLRVNFMDPTQFEIVNRGTTGSSSTTQSAWTIQARTLKQALQQEVVAYTSKTCRYRLGSTAMPAGLCMVALAPFTFTGSVTGVTSTRVFTDTAQAQADDYFVEGSVLFTSGGNAGYERKCKAFASGQFTLATPFPFAIEVGDGFTAVAGCRKRLMEDCKAKFDNVLNFGGEPHIVGTDALTADPQVG
jgi:uncharacterized phage protein (TIGR02218 family)